MKWRWVRNAAEAAECERGLGMTNMESRFIIRKRFSANFNCIAIEQRGSAESAMMVVAKRPATGMLRDRNLFVDVASCSH